LAHITPFGPVKTPAGATILQFPRSRRFAPFVIVERRGELAPREPRRVDLFERLADNDRFEPEWEPGPWDSLDNVLERDADGYAAIAVMIAGFTALLGIAAWVVL
jgi:hypothetical protein